MSHYIADGQISETWREILKTYKYAVRLNILTAKGKYFAAEKDFIEKYPHVAWVYSKEAPQPQVLPLVKSRSELSEPSPSRSP